MSFKDLRHQMVKNIFEIGLPDQDVFSFLNTRPPLDNQSLKNAYNLAIQKNRPNVVRVLINQFGFRNNFSFATDEDINFFLEDDKAILLPLLYFQMRTITFDEILYYIFKEAYPRYKKRVGVLFKKYGTRVLNNIFILSRLVDIEKNFDIVVNLDHSKLINEYVYKCLSGQELENGDTGQKDVFSWLTELNFSINRIFKILVSHKGNDQEDFYILAWDIRRMIAMVKARYGDDYVTIVKEYIGKKPRSMKEIHDKLVPLLTMLETEESEKIMLNQKLDFLEGESLFEYRISVPMTAADLLNTGTIMKHCVGAYADSVIQGSKNIINLIKGGDLVYTIELNLLSNQKFEIRQFKGYRNSCEMEGLKGEKYRKAICDLIKSHPSFKND